MSTVYQYQIYCNTEATNVYYWSTAPFTVCPNNNTHSVNVNSNSILTKISNTKVIIEEESIPTGGHYKSVCYKNVCTTGDTTHDYSYPYPISALSISFVSSSDNQDDTFEVSVGPDTIIGAITSDVSASDTVISVSQTVIDNADVGFYIKIDDATNNDELGVIKAIDTANNTITVDTAATQGFLASTPTYIKLTVKSIDNYTIGPAGRYVLGDSKIGGSYIPANTIIRLKYTNNGGSTCNFYSLIEYLY